MDQNQEEKANQRGDFFWGYIQKFADNLFDLGCPFGEILFFEILLTIPFLAVYPTLIFFLLLANWVVFSGKFDAFHLGLGVISSLFVTWISQDLLFHDRRKSWEQRITEAGAFVNFVPWLVVEIVKANLHVFKLAMTRRGFEEVAPRVVTIKTYLKTDFAKFVFANSITLTPGTITMLIRGDVIHVHTMSQFLEDDLLEGAIEKKVAEVFEPDAFKKRRKKR